MTISHLAILLYSPTDGKRKSDTSEVSRQVADDPADLRFFPGSAVEGTLVLDLKEEKEVEYVSITIQGVAKTSFTLTTQEDLYSDEETILNETKMLEPAKSLKAGGYIYTFRFVLPSGIPCSFDHPNGQITYEIIGELRTFGLYSSDLRSQIPLTISPHLDLNLMSLSDYGEFETCFDCKLENSSICPCARKKTETLRLTLSLPKRYFVEGELITFSIKIDNATKKPLNTLHVELFKTYTFSGAASFAPVPFQQSTVDKVCAEVDGPSVPPRTVRMWDDTSEFLFPEQTEPEATGLGGSCRIIDLQYFFHVTAHFEKGCCSAYSFIDQCIPVIVGNIPIPTDENNKEKV